MLTRRWPVLSWPCSRAAVGGVDDADLRQAPRQLTRPAHDARETAHAFRQRRVRAVCVDIGPMRRRAGVERRVEVFAKCRAKCRLIAAVDRYLLQHRREKVAASLR